MKEEKEHTSAKRVKDCMYKIIKSTGKINHKTTTRYVNAKR